MTTKTPETTYRLVRSDVVTEVPELDDDQRRVVDHQGGPLLVLAGPGTGKTTTLVEAIVDRVEQRGARPDQVLALTFSRKAAEQLRDRVTARLGRTMSTSLSSTFHSFAYGLVRRYSPPELYASPLRLLSAPEQDVILRELLNDHPESVTWPDELGRALATRGFAREVNAVLSRAREKGLDGPELHRLGVEHRLPEFMAAGLFLEQYLENLDHHSATDYADLIRRATIEAAEHRDELRAHYEHVFVDEYQDTDPGQVALLRQLAGDGRNLTVVGDPHQSIYGFRGAEVRGILDFPRDFPQQDGAPAEVVALRTTRRFGPHLLLASQRVAGRLALPGSIPETARAAFTDPRAEAGAFGDGRVVVRTFDTDRAEAEHLADLLRRAHLEDGIPWDDMAVLVRSGRASIPPLRRALGAAGVPVEVSSDEVPLVRDPAVLPLLDAMRRSGQPRQRRPRSRRLRPPLPGGGAAAQPARRSRRRRPPAAVAAAAPAREGACAHRGDDGPAVPRAAARGGRRCRGFLDGLEGEEVVRRQVPGRRCWPAPAPQLDDGASAEEVLWHLWAGTSWPERLPPVGARRRRLGPSCPPRPRLDLRAVRRGLPGRGAAPPPRRLATCSPR